MQSASALDTEAGFGLVHARPHDCDGGALGFHGTRIMRIPGRVVFGGVWPHTCCDGAGTSLSGRLVCRLDGDILREASRAAFCCRMVGKPCRRSP